MFKPGYRKMGVTLCVIAISTILLVLAFISSEDFIKLNQVVVPAFLGSNLIETFMNGRKKEG